MAETFDIIVIKRITRAAKECFRKVVFVCRFVPPILRLFVVTLNCIKKGAAATDLNIKYFKDCRDEPEGYFSIFKRSQRKEGMLQNWE